MKFSIEWINIGRNDFSNKIIKEFKSFEEAGLFAYKCADNHLMSSDTSLEGVGDSKEDFKVYAGFREVGQVKIHECKE